MRVAYAPYSNPVPDPLCHSCCHVSRRPKILLFLSQICGGLLAPSYLMLSHRGPMPLRTRSVKSQWPQPPHSTPRSQYPTDGQYTSPFTPRPDASILQGKESPKASPSFRPRRLERCSESTYTRIPHYVISLGIETGLKHVAGTQTQALRHSCGLKNGVMGSLPLDDTWLAT